MQETNTEDQQLITQIKLGDEESIVAVYQSHRSGFIQWAQATYKTDEPTAADAFQDAVICLHHNIVQGKLETLSCSLKTYLFAIGKNILRKKIQKDAIMDSHIFDHEESVAIENLYAEPLDSFASNDRQRFVATLMEKIGEPCKTILKLFYFKGFSMSAIAKTLEYKNENVAKTQKLRCLTTLKHMLRNQYSGDEFYGD
ncbi:sigma-70 family RNA polymerase sigma factor [Porifericola rhodea]|uniref:RNA polymerase sigma factor n=1 Tax=Porifericola rhodea TaxID=930972 RepID=UPI002665E363|nr:sigma-70 family RNA polymerase sigma factor [Porifericola rhodea]WKN30000.1 sigma-70 family RNA polymerase sigma factor [Porifericola rhodea]